MEKGLLGDITNPGSQIFWFFWASMIAWPVAIPFWFIWGIVGGF
jgi:hypothetical protein